jgi:hypothetical protein
VVGTSRPSPIWAVAFTRVLHKGGGRTGGWDEAHHGRPHFHARYAGHAASIDLDGKVIAGALPPRAQRLVAEWAAIRRVELEANWDRARREQNLEPVEPLP